MPSAGRLCFLHWNIHSWTDSAGNPNTAVVAGLIAETAPDIVSLVEVDETWGAPANLKEAADRAGYSWLFVPAFEFGDGQPRGGFGNALLTRLPITAVQQWQLLWPPRIYDGSELSEPRSVILAQLEYAGVRLWAGSLHLPRDDQQARAAALDRLRTLVLCLKDPWLICGDFNTPASSWLAGDEDLAVSPENLTYPADRPAEPIDYCIASAGINLDAKVLPGNRSDHLPQLVLADLPWPGPIRSADF